jgi:hypothetical protein
MKLELSLLELNELYYGMTKYRIDAEQSAKDMNTSYFIQTAEKAKALCDKLQTALYDECKKLDEARDYVLNAAGRDYSAFNKLANKKSK